MNQIKIDQIPLGRNKNKLKLAHQLKTDSKDKENQILIPSPLTTPIVIRYIDPRLVPLLVELGKLSLMVESFAGKSNLSQASSEKEELQELIKSSKDLSAKMSAIMQENQAGCSSARQPSTSPQQANSEYRYISAEQTLEKSIKSLKDLSMEESENIDMIDILNRVSLRMEELEQENQGLKVQLRNAQTQIAVLTEERGQIRLRGQIREKEYREILEGVKIEMQNLLVNRQSLGNTIHRVQGWLETLDRPKSQPF